MLIFDVLDELEEIRTGLKQIINKELFAKLENCEKLYLYLFTKYFNHYLAKIRKLWVNMIS